MRIFQRRLNANLTFALVFFVDVVVVALSDCHYRDEVRIKLIDDAMLSDVCSTF